MNNKRMGSMFEREFAKTLDKNGFWVHLIVPNADGQPADIIACKNKETHLIDCKVCSSLGFPLSRVEENQELAMRKFINRGKGQAWFALKFSDEIFMLDYTTMMQRKRYGEKRISIHYIREACDTLERWLYVRDSKNS